MASQSLSVETATRLESRLLSVRAHPHRVSIAASSLHHHHSLGLLGHSQPVANRGVNSPLSSSFNTNTGQTPPLDFLRFSKLILCPPTNLIKTSQTDSGIGRLELSIAWERAQSFYPLVWSVFGRGRELYGVGLESF